MIITIKFDCYNQNVGEKKTLVYVEREQNSQRKLQILESKPHIKLRKSINPTFRSKHFSAKELRFEPVQGKSRLKKLTWIWTATNKSDT